MSVFFFYTKSNGIQLFKLVEYIRIKTKFNITKNEKIRNMQTNSQHLS